MINDSGLALRIMVKIDKVAQKTEITAEVFTKNDVRKGYF